MDLLDRQLGFDEWTTLRVLDLSEGLTDEQLDQQFDIGHETLRATLEHMIFSTEIWTAAMIDKAPTFSDEDPPSLASLRARHLRSYEQFATAARKARDENRFEETFLDPWMDEDPATRTFGTTIVHNVLHNMQHRSEAFHILKRLGVGPLPDGDPKEWEEHLING